MLLFAMSSAFALEITAPTELVVETPTDLVVTGAAPGQRVHLLRSATGPGLTCHGPICAALDQPELVDRVVAGDDGNARFSLGAAPADVQGQEFWFQAVTGTGTSDVRAWTILADVDQDGYGAAGLDCDDGDAAIHPGASDKPADGIDQNCNGEDAPHWTYESPDGPDEWGSLGVDYATCDTGTGQSPIDLPAVAAGALDLPLRLTGCETPIQILNNGHTIEYEVEEGCAYTLDGVAYALLQFHFHSPSEHTWDGVPADLEVHLVHKSDDGALAVIGMPLWADVDANSFLDGAGWAMLPVNAHETYTDELTTFDPYDILQLDVLGTARHRYHGSLTTPPCTEGVRWTVMLEGATLSADQLEVFQSIYEANARNPQALNGRVITAMD